MNNIKCMLITDQTQMDLVNPSYVNPGVATDSSSSGLTVVQGMN